MKTTPFPFTSPTSVHLPALDLPAPSVREEEGVERLASDCVALYAF